MFPFILTGSIIIISIGVFISLYLLINTKKKIVKPIRIHFNRWTSTTRSTQNKTIEKLYFAYRSIEFNKLIICRIYIKSFRDDSPSALQSVDLFGRFLIPLFTFLIGASTSVFGNKIPFEVFAQTTFDFISTTVIIMSCLLVFTLFSNAINSHLKNFINIHETVIDQVYEERKEESESNNPPSVTQYRSQSTF